MRREQPIRDRQDIGEVLADVQVGLRHLEARVPDYLLCGQRRKASVDQH